MTRTVRRPGLAGARRACQVRAELAGEPLSAQWLRRGTRWVGKKSPRFPCEALLPQPLTPGARDCSRLRDQATHRWLARRWLRRALLLPRQRRWDPRPATAAAPGKEEPGAPRGRCLRSFPAPSSKLTRTPCGKSFTSCPANKSNFTTKHPGTCTRVSVACQYLVCTVSLLLSCTRA